MSLTIGTMIRGKYRVDGVLGTGGMGVVLAAWDARLERRVAIKLLHPEMLEHPELIERFLREGRAASRIEGEHVARVLDVDALDDSGVPFLVMEFLEGHDLSSVRRSKQPLPIDEAVRYVLQACSALAQAHANGVVHRDLKPANLFLTRRHDGSTCVKVLDFGISKLSGRAGESEPSVTRTTVVMGSAEYMSPEQMRSAKDTDARSDIWALGVILYELTTARVPFPGETITQVCVLVMSEPPPLPRHLRVAYPPGLEAVVLRCLEKDRSKRFASVPELMRALRPFAGAEDGAAVGEPSRGTTAILPEGLIDPRSAPDLAFIDTAEEHGASAIGRSGPSTTGAVSSGALRRAPRPRSLFAVLAISGAVMVVGAIAAFAIGGRRGATASDAIGVAEASAIPSASVAAAPVPPAPVEVASSLPVAPSASADHPSTPRSATKPAAKPRAPGPRAGKPPPSMD